MESGWEGAIKVSRGKPGELREESIPKRRNYSAMSLSNEGKETRVYQGFSQLRQYLHLGMNNSSLVGEHCLMHYMTFTRISGLLPLDASPPCQLRQNKCLQKLSSVPLEAKSLMYKWRNWTLLETQSIHIKGMMEDAMGWVYNNLNYLLSRSF